MTELKPCPFCGSIYLREPVPGALYVECLDCGAFGPNINITGAEKTATPHWEYDAAIWAWNERATYPEPRR